MKSSMPSMNQDGGGLTCSIHKNDCSRDGFLSQDLGNDLNYVHLFSILTPKPWENDPI